MNIFWKKGKISPERLLAFRCGRPGMFLPFLICAGSGALYATVFAGTDWYGLAWFGMMPLYWLIRTGSSRRAFWLSLTWGCFESLFAFMWLREIMFFIPFVFCFVLGMFPAVWGAAVPFLYRNFMIPPEIRLKGGAAAAQYECRNPFKAIAFFLVLAAWWCVTEWVRSWIFTGLPWNLIGSSQWRCLPMIQICEYTGIYGISFLVVLVNVTLADYLRQLPHGGFRRCYPLLFVLALVYLNVMSGMKAIRRVERLPLENRARIGVVQPHLSQRRSGGTEKVTEAIEVCAELTEQLLRNHPGDARPELLVWPETAVPVAYNADYPLSDLYRRTVAQLGLKSGLPMLVGSLFLKMSQTRPGEVDVYNSALLVRPGGLVADSHSKVHIVPFGEYVPYGDRFPILNRIVGMGRNLTRGPEFRPVEILPGLRAGISICYEDIFAYISRAYAIRDANALLVVTNDAWYPSSNEPVQHFANSLFRAVETRLPMIRIGNADYSAVIEPTGKVSGALFQTPAGHPDPGRTERASGILALTYQDDPQPTFYTRYGNLFIGFCGSYALLILAFALLNWRLYHQFMADVFKRPEENGVQP